MCSFGSVSMPYMSDQHHNRAQIGTRCAVLIRRIRSRSRNPPSLLSFSPILPVCVCARTDAHARKRDRKRTRAHTHAHVQEIYAAANMKVRCRPYEQTKRHKDGRRDIRDELIALPCGRCVHCAALRSSRALCRMLRSCLRLAAAQWLRVVAALVLNEQQS